VSVDERIKIWDVSTGACLHTLRPDGWIKALAFSTKNYNLVIGSDNNTIKVWDANNGVSIRTLRCHNAPVCTLTFSKNGNLMASSATDRTIKLFDTTSGECTRELIIPNGKYAAYSIAFTHDDEILSCGTYDSVLIWDLKNQTEPHRIEMEDGCFDNRSLISSHTNELFLIRNDDVEVWNPATKTRIRTIECPIHRPTYRKTLILSRHGALFGVVTSDKVEIVDPLTLEWVAQAKRWSVTSSVSPKCDSLALTSGPQINIWDLSTIAYWKNSSPSVDSRPVFSNDGSLVVTVSEAKQEIIISRSCTGESITFARPWSSKYTPIFSSDGHMLIMERQREVYVRHIYKEGVRFVLSLAKPQFGRLALSHDNRWLAVPFYDHVSIFELGTPSTETRISCNEVFRESTACSFSHDSKTLAVLRGRYIYLYESNTWRCNSTLCNVERAGYQFGAILFSSDDRFLATTSLNPSKEETELKVWNLETTVCTRILYREGCFHPLKLEALTFLQLETDLCTFQIVNERVQQLIPPKYTISKDLQWILQGSERLIWLPLDYRPKTFCPFVEFRFCRACSKFKVAIITVNSRLVVLTLP